MAHKYKYSLLFIVILFAQCRKDADLNNVDFDVRNSGEIERLICDSLHYFGNLIAGREAENVSFTLFYIGGNGDAHGEVRIQSNAVEGLQAELAPSVFEIGKGSLEFKITGVPANKGVARFTILIGGLSCEVEFDVYESLYPNNSAFCADETEVVDVLNPITGRIWMDRNLGASQVATEPTDVSSYGYLHQWGRFSDGHQCRNSEVQSELSGTAQPQHSNFITVSEMPFDWKSPQDDALWSGNSNNNPCPNGYRLPTPEEFLDEVRSWKYQNGQGAFESVLKLPLSGHRHYANGIVYGEGSNGYYWTSSTSGYKAIDISFNQHQVKQDSIFRADGSCIRCIKNQ